MTEEIIKNIAIINGRIKDACRSNGRNPDEVKFLLATKTVPAERIKIALQAGQTLIAENKIQEVKEKYEALREVPHESHFIGHLQSTRLRKS